MICLALVFIGPVSSYAGTYCHTGPGQPCGGHTCYPWTCTNGQSGEFCSNGLPAAPYGERPADPPSPPSPPPPVYGQCGAANGHDFFSVPTALCSPGSAIEMTGNGPWSWKCAASDGTSGQCNAGFIATSSVSCTVSPSCPNTANVNEDVTWTTIVSGAAGPFTYAWTGDDFVQGKTTASITGKYTVPSVKQAAVTVSDSASRNVSVVCPSTCDGGGNNPGGPGGSGGPGRGIRITSNGVCNPRYVGDIPVPPNQSALCLNGAVNSFTEHQSDNPWSDNTTWKWLCKGLNPTAGDKDATCEANLISEAPSPSLDCSLYMSNPFKAEKVNLNINTTWTVNATSSGAVVWKITDANGSSYPVGVGSLMDKIFTTTGLKTVSAKIASTTFGVFGLPCTATTTIVTEGGAIREQ